MALVTLPLLRQAEPCLACVPIPNNVDGSESGRAQAAESGAESSLVHITVMAIPHQRGVFGRSR